jgi:NAD(P)-dependent dehydrogenase (short-subunit alcohol dehydrogenase family)
VLGRSLANSLGSRNVTVNTISPGITETDMNPSIRDKNAEEIGRVAGMTALGRPGPLPTSAMWSRSLPRTMRGGSPARLSKLTVAYSWDQKTDRSVRATLSEDL